MKLSLVLVLTLLAFNVVASKKAVTDDGDVVILNDDGTWVYEIPLVPVKITENLTEYSKNTNSKFKIKSSKTNSAFWLDPKIWSFIKNDAGAAEYTFTLKGGDLYGMAITEAVEFNVEELVNIAFKNAKAAAPDISVIKKEYRSVNGLRVIYMEMEGTIQSVKFTYFGYYYSNGSGATQYLAYTGSNLRNKYQDDINKFLNGFDIQK